MGKWLDWFARSSAAEETAPLPSPSADIAREAAKLKEEVGRLTVEVDRIKDTREMFEELVRSVRRME